MTNQLAEIVHELLCGAALTAINGTTILRVADNLHHQTRHVFIIRDIIKADLIRENWEL